MLEPARTTPLSPRRRASNTLDSPIRALRVALSALRLRPYAQDLPQYRRSPRNVRATRNADRATAAQRQQSGGPRGQADDADAAGRWISTDRRRRRACRGLTRMREACAATAQQTVWATTPLLLGAESAPAEGSGGMWRRTYKDAGGVRSGRAAADRAPDDDVAAGRKISTSGPQWEREDSPGCRRRARRRRSSRLCARRRRCCWARS